MNSIIRTDATSSTLRRLRRAGLSKPQLILQGRLVATCLRLTEEALRRWAAGESVVTIHSELEHAFEQAWNAGLYGAASALSHATDATFFCARHQEATSSSFAEEFYRPNAVKMFNRSRAVLSCITGSTPTPWIREVA